MTTNSNRAKSGSIAGSVAKNGYLLVGVDGKREYAHRVIYAITHGSWPTSHIDHVNGNKLDNRPVNLRLATRSQNLANRGKNKNNTSGYKGVWLDKKSGRWVAEITSDGERRKLWGYRRADEAAIAYCEEAKKSHGEFARTTSC
jgi:hypothetical protein